jgi:thioesterase domain-containing protein
VLCQLWQELLGVSQIGVDDDFFELGGHSLLLVSVLHGIRERLSAELSIRALLERPTVASLAALIGEQGACMQVAPPRPARDASLVPLADGQGEPIFCVHPAGGDVLCFADLAKRLAPWPVFGLQSPGMAGEREPFTRVRDLAAHFVQVISQTQPSGAVRLAGWSLGAHVAVEIAAQLSQSGRDVALLALLDADPDAGAEARRSLPNELAFQDNAHWLHGIAEYVERLWGQKLALPELAGLSPDAQVAAFVDAAKRASLPHGLVPAAPQLARVLAVYKANVRALIDHAPQPYAGPAALLFAEGSRAWAERARAGWRKALTGEVAAQIVPGDHYTLLAEPHVDVVAAALRALLDDGGDR